jgi:hypothetical protein
MEASVSGIVPAPNPAAQANAASMKGWMKFIGIVQIVAGAVNALSIIGILWAWLPIWIGIILVQAGSKAGDYAAKGDAASLEAMTGRLKTYFIISGVMMIVSIAVGILAGIVWAVLLAAGIFSMSDIMDKIHS